VNSEGISAAKIADSVICWSCGAPSGSGHFCAACGKIQPLARGTDYFAFLGLPRKLTIDPEELERRFHQLSWKLHPDNFTRASEGEREIALARSSQLNDAFRALRDPVSRVEYLLSSAGMRRERQQKQQAPPELLEEVFELNESLDELRNSAETAVVRRKLEAARWNFGDKLGQVDGELERLFADWDKSVADGGEAPGAGDEQKRLMERMNETLNRRSYIRNLVASVQKELEEA
jgi:molecular chaperone HscB